MKPKLETLEWKIGAVNCKAVRQIHDDLPGEPGTAGPGHWCGYVQIPRDSPLNTKIADAWGWNVDVHGGITNTHQDKDNFWWVGFDCGHYGDALSPSAQTENRHYWTLREVKDETNRLVEQLLKLTVEIEASWKRGWSEFESRNRGL